MKNKQNINEDKIFKIQYALLLVSVFFAFHQRDGEFGYSDASSSIEKPEFASFVDFHQITVTMFNWYVVVIL